MGLHGGARRKDPPMRRKKVGRRHNGIPPNPYDQLALQSGESDYDEEELIPFEDVELD